MKKCFVLTMMAGLAVAPAAMAQSSEFGPIVGPATGLTRVDGQPIGGGYDDRALVYCFDAITSQAVGIFGRSWIVDDFSFAPGPWAVTQGTTARINYSLGRAATTVTSPAQVRITFKDIWGPAGPGVHVTSGSTIAVFTSPLFNVPAGPPAYFTGLQTAFAATFLDAANAVEIELLDDTGTRYPNPLPATAPVNVFTISPIATGSSDTMLYRDLTNDGIVDSTEGTTGGQPRAGVYLSLEFDDVPPLPPIRESIPALADGLTSRTGQALDNSANAAIWYEFTFTGNAYDNILQFLDIDSEGSSSGVDFAVYDTLGNLIMTDADSGSGTNAQLSIGVGRRAAVGDGRQYDGRNWDRRTPADLNGLAAGTYLLAVAPDGAVFTNGYNVNCAAGSGSFSLNFNTNVNGTPVGPSVAPAGANVEDAGLVDGLLAFPPVDNLLAYDVRIIKFQTCTDAVDDGDPGSSGSYLDIDGQRSQDILAEWFVFDSNGNLIAADAGSGPGNRSQLSFGDMAPSRGAIGDGLPFDGIDGNLPAGTYYLYISYDGFTFVPTPGTAGRWHLKGAGGSNGWDYQADAIPSWSGCPAPCDPDVNCDGSANGLDVEIMELAVGGDLTDFCQADTDFNQDGSTNGGDIEAVENAVAGICP